LANSSPAYSKLIRTSTDKEKYVYHTRNIV
jgi:hypothetical protein